MSRGITPKALQGGMIDIGGPRSSLSPRRLSRSLGARRALPVRSLASHRLSPSLPLFCTLCFPSKRLYISPTRLAIARVARLRGQLRSLGFLLSVFRFPHAPPPDLGTRSYHHHARHPPPRQLGRHRRQRPSRPRGRARHCRTSRRRDERTCRHPRPPPNGRQRKRARDGDGHVDVGVGSESFGSGGIRDGDEERGSERTGPVQASRKPVSPLVRAFSSPFTLASGC